MTKAAIFTRETGSYGRREVLAYSGPYSYYHKWDHALSVADNHRFAAMQFLVKMRWDGQSDLIAGVGSSGSYVFIQVPREHRGIVPRLSLIQKELVE